MHDIREIVTSWLGLETETLTVSQMALRAVIVYVVAVAMVRIGEKRFLGKNTAFDVILGIILGLVVSRAITGSSPFSQRSGPGSCSLGSTGSLPSRRTTGVGSAR